MKQKTAMRQHIDDLQQAIDAIKKRKGSLQDVRTIQSCIDNGRKFLSTEREQIQQAHLNGQSYPLPPMKSEATEYFTETFETP